MTFAYGGRPGYSMDPTTRPRPVPRMPMRKTDEYYLVEVLIRQDATTSTPKPSSFKYFKDQRDTKCWRDLARHWRDLPDPADEELQEQPQNTTESTAPSQTEPSRWSKLKEAILNIFLEPAVPAAASNTERAAAVQMCLLMAVSPLAEF